MWKKKYFQEKKKTSPIEDRVAQLKTDVDFFHSKTVQVIENDSKQVGSGKETELRVNHSTLNQPINENFILSGFVRPNHSHST